MNKYVTVAKGFLLFIITYSLFIISSFAQCNDSLWHYVYHPNRFIINEQCVTVSGTIMSKKREADGDYHIRLKLDSAENKYLNAKNYEIQKGCLVIEVICFRKVKQADAIAPCRHCPTGVYIPRRGEHVKVTGTFVTDNQHGWNEIHP